MLLDFRATYLVELSYYICKIFEHILSDSVGFLCYSWSYNKMDHPTQDLALTCGAGKNLVLGRTNKPNFSALKKKELACVVP